jgi:hypothetical protein
VIVGQNPAKKHAQQCATNNAKKRGQTDGEGAH